LTGPAEAEQALPSDGGGEPVRLRHSLETAIPCVGTRTATAPIVGTRDVEAVTCPECRGILSEQKERNEEGART
jgi:hypothetical protein